MYSTIPIDLFEGLKKIVSIGILVDSPTHRVGELFFDEEYLCEYEAKIGTARNVPSVKDQCQNDLCKNPRKSAS